MIEVYAVVAITATGLQQKLITPDNYGHKAIDYNKKIRTYTVIQQARVYRNRLRKATPSLKQGGADYRIARLRINEDMTLETEWVE